MNVAQPLWPHQQLVHPPHLHPAFLQSSHLDLNLLEPHFWVGRLPGHISTRRCDSSTRSFTIDAILGNKAAKAARLSKRVDKHRYTTPCGRVLIEESGQARGINNNGNARPDSDGKMKITTDIQHMKAEDSKRNPMPYQYESNHTVNFVESGVFGAGGHCKNKRVRTIFTPEQLERLEAVFLKQQYMVGTERYYLAASLNLSEAQVKVWFQNRRIKWRKQQFEAEHHRYATSDIFQHSTNSAFSGVAGDLAGSSECIGSTRSQSVPRAWANSYNTHIVLDTQSIDRVNDKTKESQKYNPQDDRVDKRCGWTEDKLDQDQIALSPPLSSSRDASFGLTPVETGS